jgi:hypothetical protein
MMGLVGIFMGLSVMSTPVSHAPESVAPASYIGLVQKLSLEKLPVSGHHPFEPPAYTLSVSALATQCAAVNTMVSLITTPPHRFGFPPPTGCENTVANHGKLAGFVI